MRKVLKLLICFIFSQCCTLRSSQSQTAYLKLSQKYELQRITYRMHQVMNRHSDDIFRNYTAGVTYNGIIILISSGFVVVRLVKVMLPKIIAGFWISAFVFVFALAIFLWSYSIQIRTVSNACCTSNLLSSLGRSKASTSFWKSCKPIYMSVGSLCKIETKLFILRYYSTVFQTLATVLLCAN